MSVVRSHDPAEEVAGHSSRERQRLETRRRIFEAAMAEFARNGFAPAQIEDIVRAAGVARGTFYIHFPTKDHVLLEYVERLQRRAAEPLALLTQVSARLFFRDAIDIVLDVVGGEDPIILREALSVISRHVDELGNVAPLYTGLTAFFEAAQGRGEIRLDILPSELSAAFLPGLFGLLLLRLGAPESELRTTLHHAVDVFVRGIAP
jgi:AcrR family transcriptional regulator